MKARIEPAVGLGVVLQIALILTGFTQPLLIPVNALTLLVATAALWSLGRRAAYTRGRERLAWGLAAAAALLGLPAAELNLRAAVRGPDGAGADLTSPQLTLGGIAAALLLLCLIAGPGASLPWRERLRMLLDGTMAAVALFVPAWAFLLRPTYQDVGRTFTTQIGVLVCVPIATVALALVLLSRQRADGPNAFTLVAGAAGTFATTTVLYGTLVIHGLATEFAALAPLLAVGTYLLLAMTWYPMPTDLPRWAGAPTGLRASLPYLPVLVAVPVGAAQRSDDTVLAALAVLFALVLLRQFLVLHSNNRLLAEVEEKRAELQHQATHDHLTGLANRSYLYECAARWGGAPVALMILDLDGFKEINDRFGHAAGDEVLVEVAGALRAVVPAGHTAARLGGDEFAVVLHPAPSIGDSAAIGERLIEAVSAKGRVGVSLGLAYEATGRATLGMMLSDADAALYKAKAAGKGRLAMSSRLS